MVQVGRTSGRKPFRMAETRTKFLKWAPETKTKYNCLSFDQAVVALSRRVDKAVSFYIWPHVDKKCFDDSRMGYIDKIIFLAAVRPRIVLLQNRTTAPQQSLPFRTMVYWRFHEEDEVLIAEIQLMLTQTLLP